MQNFFIVLSTLFVNIHLKPSTLNALPEEYWSDFNARGRPFSESKLDERIANELRDEESRSDGSYEDGAYLPGTSFTTINFDLELVRYLLTKYLSPYPDAKKPQGECRQKSALENRSNPNIFEITGVGHIGVEQPQDLIPKR